MTVEINENVVLALVNDPRTDNTIRHDLMVALDRAYTEHLLEMMADSQCEEVF